MVVKIEGENTKVSYDVSNEKALEIVQHYIEKEEFTDEIIIKTKW